MDHEETKLAARLGAGIRAHRHALGWSQAELAEAVDVTPHYVGLLERGLRLPTVRTLVVLARSLATSPDRLLGEPAGSDPWRDEAAALASAVPTVVRSVVRATLSAAAGLHVVPARRYPERARRPKAVAGPVPSAPARRAGR